MCELRIQCNGLLKKGFCRPEIVLMITRASSVPASLEIKVVRLQVGGPDPPKFRLLFGGYGGAESIGDGLGDFGLDGQQVGHRQEAVERGCPRMVIRLSINELHVESHRVTGS